MLPSDGAGSVADDAGEGAVEGGSEREVAAVLGCTLGRDLHVATLPGDAWAQSLTDAGFRPHIAAALAELYRADEAGLLAPRGDRVVRTATRIDETIARMLRPVASR